MVLYELYMDYYDLVRELCRQEGVKLWQSRKTNMSEDRYALDQVCIDYIARSYFK